jgi:hypothetical protein
MTAMRRLAAVALILVGCQASIPPSASTPPRQSGTPAADAVVEAFAGHAVVAIGEWHRSRVEHDFLRLLLGDPRLVGLMDDVAVEFGSARHQRTIDRYLRGEAVTEADLSLVWTDTTQQSGVWNDPVYRQFFDRIRELNRDRAPAERIRVLLGDPPIDWSDITETVDCDDSDPSCLDYWIFRRDEHFAAVVQASIERGRRVLVIAGAGHMLRNPDEPERMSLVDVLDASNPGQVWTLVPPAPSWNALRAFVDEPADGIPRAVVLDNTDLGGLPAEPAFESGTVTCDPAPCPSPEDSSVPLERVTDALLLL